MATVNAGSDFFCLRLLALAAELPWELPDWGRLENSPPTASAAGVNTSGLLLPWPLMSVSMPPRDEGM